MFIACGNGLSLVNISRYDRIELIQERDDTWVMYAYRSDPSDKSLVPKQEKICIGRFMTEEEARKCLEDLGYHIRKGYQLFWMPETSAIGRRQR